MLMDQGSPGTRWTFGPFVFQQDICELMPHQTGRARREALATSVVQVTKSL